MTKKKKARETHQKITNLLKELEHHLSETTDVPNLTVQEFKTMVEQPKTEEKLDSFESLKKALLSNRWPEAVNPHLVCNPESLDDKMERGRGIIEMFIEEDLKELKFLDYGCGEGQCVSLTTDMSTKISVGYDNKESSLWSTYPKKDNVLFTTDFEKVKENGPYDVILLFDVIDHIVGEDPSMLLVKLASILSAKGKIYMRTHPFTSRHATHLYHSLNKAYIHLIFTPDELKQLIPEPKYSEPNIGITTPLATYDSYISKAGLKTLSKRDLTKKVEPFFQIPKIAERIMKNLNKNTFPEFQMQMVFLDYVLVKQ